jgi:hypothetical protein
MKNAGISPLPPNLMRLLVPRTLTHFLKTCSRAGWSLALVVRAR